MTMDMEPGAVARRSWDVWNGGDLDALDALVDEESQNFGQPSGKARTRAILTAWRTAFPDLTFVVEEEIVHEDRVAHRVTVRGTYLGTFKLLGLESVKPTGRSFEVMQIHMSRVRNGRTVEHWGARDDLGMLRQLGVLPASVAP